jgi:Flp pilus assembly pilin Flp
MSPGARTVNPLREEGGGVAAEYGILIAAIVVLVVLATGTLEDALALVLRDAADCVEVGCL